MSVIAPAALLAVRSHGKPGKPMMLKNAHFREASADNEKTPEVMVFGGVEEGKDKSIPHATALLFVFLCV
jgi:hypothetical protein